ncbi:site-specific integrase [Acinetobacter variabilis]
MDEYRKEDGTPLIQENPVNILKKKMVKLKPRTSRIPDSKVNDVWKYLWSTRETAFNRETLASIDLIIFLMLTGARLGEARSLTWDRVNLEEAWWHIPDPKNHNPVYLPLSTQAIELLKARHRTEGSPFVFASWSKSGHIIDPRDSLKRMSEVAGTPITAHDLRRTFTTIGVAHCGIDLNKVELLTNHVPKGVTAIHYLETTHLQYLRPEVQQVADWIDKSKS